MTKAKKKEARQRGRPAVAPEDELVVGSIRLKRAHWAKLAEIGGQPRLRRWLDKARPPAPGESEEE